MLTILRRIIQEIHSAQDFDAALLVLVQRVKEALDAKACALFLVDRRFSDFVLLATKGFSAKSVANVRVDLDKGLLGYIATYREPLNLADASMHPDYMYIENLGEEKFKGFLGVPIIYQRRLLGVLLVQKIQEEKFSNTSEAFLVTLAMQLAEEISRAQANGLISKLAIKSHALEEALYHGLPSAPGVGIGIAVVVYPLADLDAVPDKQAQDVDKEIVLFRDALSEIRQEIKRISKRLEANLSPEDRALFDAYLFMLDDAGLGAEVEQEIYKGHWAQGALRKVINTHVRQFENLDDAYLSDRAEDVRDLGQRILARLQEEERKTPEYHDKVILVGQEVTAANLGEVPVENLQGIISGSGSSNSHVAILARSLGIPAVMGVADLGMRSLEKKTLIVDGYYGHAYLDPSDIVMREFERLAKEECQLNEELNSLRSLPAQTLDGRRINMMINTGLSADLGLSLSVGADGVGLYRSEIPFLSRELFPTASEQKIIYKQLLTAFSPKPVTMRTLDIGGDKALPYLPIKEENPFLGWRGIRITLDHPEVFLTQVKAMLKASYGFDNLRIMLPMISDVNQVEEAKQLIYLAHGELVAQGLLVNMPEIGVMIEVPSAVYQTRLIAKQVDFISVGSNDLTQYLLAVDRNNAKVSNLYDSYHPAVLMALSFVIEQAHNENIPVSICGEMAGDPVAALLLLGMGFDGLSMSAARLSRTKWVIRQFSYAQAKSLAKDVLQMDNTMMIRNRLESELENAGLGGLIRAGRS